MWLIFGLILISLFFLCWAGWKWVGRWDCLTKKKIYLVGSPKVSGAEDGKHTKKYGHPKKNIPIKQIFWWLLDRLLLNISPKFENFGGIMFLVAPSPPPPHANACTGHNFVTNTPIKFLFAIAIEIPDYKNPMIFGINRKNKMASGGHFV